MNRDDVKKAVEAAGIKILSEERLPNDTGYQLKLDSGTTVACYDSGKHVLGGKNQERVKEALGSGYSAQSSSAGAHRRVFVVYGHDRQSRDQLEMLLRRWDLEPLILDQLPSAGQTIIEKLEAYSEDVEFAVVLATPDDEGHRTGHPDEKSLRARQNVVLELGMLLGKLGRAKVAILLKQQEKMERPSDIQGLIYIPFKEDLAKEASVLLAKEMTALGYYIPVGKL